MQEIVKLLRQRGVLLFETRKRNSIHVHPVVLVSLIGREEIWFQMLARLALHGNSEGPCLPPIEVILCLAEGAREGVSNIDILHDFLLHGRLPHAN
jgi:hypothetical protein